MAHPGGPFWAKKDNGAWSIPKGEYQDGEEDGLDAAKREFVEETGFQIGAELLALGEVKQTNGKIVSAWAFCGDCEPSQLVCNTFELEWPPKSGKRQTFPEIDRVQWFETAQARDKILPAQIKFLDNLEVALFGGIQPILSKPSSNAPAQESLF